MYDWLIVGAGFAGSVLAERLARERDERVLVIDRRDHVGGNAFDVLNEDGLLIHRYGPHIFHTNAKSVFDHLSRFTEWRPYEHRVLAQVDGQRVPIPRPSLRRSAVDRDRIDLGRPFVLRRIGDRPAIGSSARRVGAELDRDGQQIPAPVDGKLHRQRVAVRDAVQSQPVRDKHPKAALRDDTHRFEHQRALRSNFEIGVAARCEQHLQQVRIGAHARSRHCSIGTRAQSEQGTHDRKFAAVRTACVGAVYRQPHQRHVVARRVDVHSAADAHEGVHVALNDGRAHLAHRLGMEITHAAAVGGDAAVDQAILDLHFAEPQSGHEHDQQRDGFQPHGAEVEHQDRQHQHHGGQDDKEEQRHLAAAVVLTRTRVQRHHEHREQQRRIGRCHDPERPLQICEARHLDEQETEKHGSLDREHRDPVREVALWSCAVSTAFHRLSPSVSFVARMKEATGSRLRLCQRQVQMSHSQPSRNVAFLLF